MSAAPQIQPVQPSKFFHGLLEALLNASTEDYDARLEEVSDYVAALENSSVATVLQGSVTFAIRTKETERTAIRKTLAKLTRVDHAASGMKPADLGDYVSFYDMISAVR